MSATRAAALPLELRTLLASLTSAEVADDQQWILALLRSHALAAVSMLWRMLGCEADVLDAYQTVVCRLAACGPQRLGRNPGGYFYRTAVNAGIEILRRRKAARAAWPGIAEARTRHESTQQWEHDGASAYDHRRLLERMREAVLELPAYLRDVIVLHDLAELPYAKVAGVLGITEGSARVYRREAVVRLADLLGPENQP
jgi:RNA polymerase sigma factor (sigma-70 family)